jgi:hypothetical protein
VTWNSTCHVWSCNQLRRKIGVGYGNPETISGGRARKFYAGVRLHIRKIGVVKNGEQPVGNKTRLQVVKNKVAPPFHECEFEILYDGAGVSAVGEIVDLASEAGLLEQSGAHYAWNCERIAHSRDKACQCMREHPELFEELRGKLVALRKAENARLGAPAPSPPGRARPRSFEDLQLDDLGRLGRGPSGIFPRQTDSTRGLPGRRHGKWPREKARQTAATSRAHRAHRAGAAAGAVGAFQRLDARTAPARGALASPAHALAHRPPRRRAGGEGG